MDDIFIFKVQLVSIHNTGYRKRATSNWERHNYDSVKTLFVYLVS